jgi:hypothetical protein
MGNVYKKAEVKKVLDNSRVLVELASGELGTIQQEVFAPNVPLSWIFTEGMELSGDWDPTEKTFLPHKSAQSAADVAGIFGLGNVTLGLVQAATRKTADVAIIPGLVFELSKSEITGNPLDVISSYLDVGDVIPVRIYRHPEGKIRLRMDDIDDDEEVLESLPIFPGGQPWLEVDRDIPWLKASEQLDTAPIPLVSNTDSGEAEGAELAQVLTPVPGPGLHSIRPSGKADSALIHEKNEAIHAAKHAASAQRRLQDENELLREQRLESDKEVIKYKAKVLALGEEIAELRQQLSESRKQKRAQQSSRSSTFSRRDRWATDTDWFNEELRRAWIGRYKPSERASKYPLNFERFGFAPGFFASINSENLSEEEIRKTVRVILDIATGRNSVEHKHTVHEKFTHLGGPQESRGDGALLWRVHLESGVPAAKRLHYWLRRDGFIDFGWVANHDDDL